MTNEWVFLILVLIASLITGVILLYYFIYITKKKKSGLGSQSTEMSKPIIKPISSGSEIDSVQDRGFNVNAENLLKDTANKQSSIVNNLSLLIQKVDNIEKSQKVLFDSYMQLKTSMSNIKPVPSSIDGPKDVKLDKLYGELEKIMPFLKTIIDSDMPFKLKAQEDILKQIKESLTTSSVAGKVDKMDIKGMDDLKNKLNEIITLLKTISIS